MYVYLCVQDLDVHIRFLQGWAKANVLGQRMTREKGFEAPEKAKSKQASSRLASWAHLEPQLQLVDINWLQPRLQTSLTRLH
jgi:hypothetical protein